MCRVSSEHLDKPNDFTLPLQVACLIPLNEQILSIQYADSDKLDLPGGKVARDESPQCAAHRHTWKTSGFNVEVGRFLGSDETNTKIYQCTLAGNFTGELQSFPVPKWANSKVKSIQLIDPFVMQSNDWQGGSRLIQLRDMFIQSTN